MTTIEKPIGVPTVLPLQTRAFKAMDDTYSAHVLIGDAPVVEVTGYDEPQPAIDAAVAQFVTAVRVAASPRKRRPAKKGA